MKRSIKKLSVAVAMAICTVLLFALSACSGATNVLSSYVRAVKDNNMTKAAEYVKEYKEPAVILDIKVTASQEVQDYMWDKTVKSFKYEVKQSSDETNSAGEVVSTKITISYEVYSLGSLKSAIVKRIPGTIIGTTECTKTDVDACMEGLEKKFETLEVTVLKTDDGWKLDNASAAGVYYAMT